MANLYFTSFDNVNGPSDVVEGDVIKTPSDPHVFLVENGTKRWIPDEPTFLSRWSWDALKMALLQTLPRSGEMRSGREGRAVSDGAVAN